MTWRPDLPANSTLAASAEVRTNWGHVEQSLGARNLIINDNGLLWPAGDALPPAMWTLTGTGAAIARSGPGLGDTNSYGTGFASKITYGSAVAQLTQDIVAATLLPTYFRGRTFVGAMGIKTSNINQARVGIYDGVGTTYSSYHTGGGAWEWLEVTRVMDAAATRLQFVAEVGAAGTAYFEAAVCMYGEIPPPLWVPCDTITGTIYMPVAGTLAVATDVGNFEPARPGLVRWVQLRVKTGNTGADLIVDFNSYDGSALTTMFTTKPKIVAGATRGGAAPDGTYARRCLGAGLYGSTRAPGDEVSADIDQIGSTIAGADLSIHARVQQYVRAWDMISGAAA